MELSEAEKIGAKRLISAAKDPDLGQNSYITYAKTREEVIHNFGNSFSRNNKPYFDIRQILSTENKLGKLEDLELILLRELNREEISAIKIEITATDRGIPPKSSLARIRINILDVNEHPPEFSQPNYLVNISEDFPLYTSFFTVQAKDPDDIDKVNRIKYSIRDSIAADIVSVDEYSGELKLLKNMDYETMKQQKIIVVAEDNGVPSLTSRAIVTLNVLDENEFAPQITSLNCPEYLKIRENQPIGTEISCKFFINDEDSGRNAEGNCHLCENSQKYFELIPPNIKRSANSYRYDLKGIFYSLKTKIPIDRESGLPSSITITCIDNPLDSSKNKTGILELKVLIEDENDNIPVAYIEGSPVPSCFGSEMMVPNQDFTVEFRENKKIGTYITKVFAHDCDQGLLFNSRGTFQFES